MVLRIVSSYTKNLTSFCFFLHTYFKNLKRKKIVFSIQPEICHFCCFAFNPEDPFRWKISLVFLKKQFCSWWILLAFLHLRKNVFILFSFLVDTFTGCRIWGWQFISLKHLKLFDPLLPSVVFDEKSMVVLITVYLYIMSLFSSCRQDFIFISSDWLWCIWLQLFWLCAVQVSPSFLNL